MATVKIQEAPEATETPDVTVCSSRSCDQLAVGVGAFTDLILCQSHLDRDVQMVEIRKTELLNKLQMVMDPEHRAALRAEQSSLAAEVQQVIDMFDAVQEKLQHWKDKAASRVQAVHDSIARRLRDSTEAEECSKEVSLACSAGELGKVMELAESKEPWLNEACDRVTEFERVRSELRNRRNRPSDDQVKDENLRSVGDVSAGVEQLQFMIDRHMVDVMQHCWLDEGDASGGPPPVCRFVESVDGLMGNPVHLTSCSNTAGFVGDSSGRVVRAELAATAETTTVPLPHPCVFVSFELAQESRTGLDHLLATSVDGRVRLQVHSGDFDWSKAINGLHCDSRRQLLFVAQSRAVIAMDLSGCVSREINAGSLCQPVGSIRGLDGDSAKLFVLDARNVKVLVVGKDSGELLTVIDVSFLPCADIWDTSNVLTLHGTKLQITDGATGQVHRVCSIGGQLIVSYPRERSSVEMFKWPVQVAFDSRGLMFVGEFDGLAVRVLLSDGTILQTLEGLNDADSHDFRHSTGIAVLEGDGRQLVVADYSNKRLCVFHVL